MVKLKDRGYMLPAKSVEWATPDYLFNKLNQEYGPFVLDVAATKDNAKCNVYYDKEKDGLEQSWCGKVWCNPPYGHPEISKWMNKASRELPHCEIIVMLLPARTDTAWFHDFIYHNPHASYTFLRGRLKSQDGGRGPIGSLILVLRP